MDWNSQYFGKLHDLLVLGTGHEVPPHRRLAVGDEDRLVY